MSSGGLPLNISPLFIVEAFNNLFIKEILYINNQNTSVVTLFELIKILYDSALVTDFFLLPRIGVDPYKFGIIPDRSINI